MVINLTTYAPPFKGLLYIFAGNTPMLRSIGISFLILLFACNALAIEAIVSHAVFYLPDPSRSNRLMPSVEAYWQINPHSVHYTTTPEKTIIARIKTDVVFANEIGILRKDQFILQTIPRASINELMGQKIIDLRRYFVTPGTIKMKIKFTDLADSTHPFTFSDSFTIAATGKRPFYSDLQLLDTTIESPAQTAFKKNGRQQVPACMNFLDNNRSEIHYYTELYQVDQVSKADYPIIQKIFIAKSEDEAPFGNLIRTDTITNLQTNFISGTFPINTLSSGNWYLNVTLENNSGIIIASASQFFQRLNTNPAPIKVDSVKKAAAAVDTGLERVNVLNLSKTFVAKYTIPETHEILKMLLPVSDPLGTQTIRGFLRKPDDIYVRYFIYNHFVSINKKDPGEAWKEYAEKVRVVNKRFTEGSNLGYLTERGFIYLRYGEPTEIITVENESGTLPYEVWQYNTLVQMNRKEIANAVFLFYKPNQDMGGYRLLHSSVAGEAQNPSWRSYLYVNGGGGNNGNSRAEQYMSNK